MNKASGWWWNSSCAISILKDDAVKVLHSICQQIWKTQQWPQDWKRSVFIPIPKKGNAKECSNYRTMVLISHASKVMLKILQSRLQQGMTEDEMAGWHHWLDGHEFEWTQAFWTGRPGMLWFMGSQRVGHDWVTELNWRILILDSFSGSGKIRRQS